MAIININGVDLPAPTSFKLPRFDLDSSDTNRNEQGVMQRDRVRQGIYKIELMWKAITSPNLHIIESAIEPSEVQVTFPTPTGFATKKMYAGDRIIEMVMYHNQLDEIRWDVSFSLTEY